MRDISELTAILDSLKIEYSTDEPMNLHTSFRIGGDASVFIVPRTPSELSSAYKAAKQTGIPVYILGKGTNVLFDDEGYDGAVISTLGLDTLVCDGNRLRCGAGFSLTALSRVALDESLEGLEFAFGIPGSVGGGVYMNAGAYDGEVSFVLESSTYFDTDDATLHTLTHEMHDFGYRHSSYKDHPERIVLEAVFVLKSGSADSIRAKMDDYMERRKTKQPLEYPSAGSVFKRYPGRYTAQMIDEAGLKGASVGGAKVSEKHAGFIINTGDAKCSDVLGLITLIKDEIRKKFGIDIETEIIYVGKV
ncbi:MAG: UDP-N-acetylmuramate dehydrogenase [Clostridia bacterium]|nr:UDP-N-acetylmuramate dehydrogenase [Clostridia bacterium]